MCKENSYQQAREIGQEDEDIACDVAKTYIRKNATETLLKGVYGI
jgi:hypothetical protein